MMISELLETAATALRRSVEHEALPPLPPIDPRPKHRRRAVAIATAILIIVIVGAAVALTKGDEQATLPAVRVPPTATGDEDHFRLSRVPDGMVLQLVMDEGSSRSFSGLAQMYDQRYIRFDDTRTHPVAELDILSGPNPHEPDLSSVFAGVAGGLGDTVQTTEIRGHPGIRIGPLIAWEETSDQVVAVVGSNDLDELQRIAQGLEPRATGTGYDLTYVPAGYESVGELPGQYSENADSTVDYGQNPNAKRLTISVVKDAPTPLLTALTTRAPSRTRVVEVRGETAIFIAEPGGFEEQQLIWDERPGLRITFTASNFTLRQLRELARDLVPLTDAQWDRFGAPHAQLLNGATPSNLRPVAPGKPSGKVTVAEGKDEGTTWRLVAYTGKHGDLCVDLRVTGVSAGGCGADDDTVGVSRFVGAGTWLSGRAAYSVNLVRVMLSDGRTLDAFPEGNDFGFAGSFYALKLPEGATATTVSYLDGFGQTLDVKPVPSLPSR